MTDKRLHSLHAQCKAVAKRLKANGYVRLNSLPRVTLEEQRELCMAGRTGMAGLVRTMRYGDSEYMTDSNLPGRVFKGPQVREFWIGSRSLDCINIESQADDDRFIFGGEDRATQDRLTNLEREDQAEVTDLVTLLYHDPATGEPMMEDPDTGELRPLRVGDMVTVVRGVNDDLDSLFMDETDDPRQMNDWGAEGTDHKWSGRFRRNTETEHRFLTGKRYCLPNSADNLPEGVRWSPDDLTIRRLAQNMFERWIETHPEDEPRRLAVTDAAEAKIRRMIDDFQMVDGQVVSGYFMSKSEFFGTIEENMRKLDTMQQRPKQAPKPVDWQKLRTQSQKVQRSKKLAALSHRE